MNERDDEYVFRLCIVTEARRIAAELGANETSGSCLYWALAAILAARLNGVSLIPQAGTCYWPRVTPETDDGIEPDRFGYEWRGDPKTADRAADFDPGVTIVLPEMHIWAADPKTGEVVDLAARLFPAQCKRITGLDWKAPHPPEWFWGKGEDTPPLTRYLANRDATLLANELMHDVLTRDIVRRLAVTP